MKKPIAYITTHLGLGYNSTYLWVTLKWGDEDNETLKVIVDHVWFYNRHKRQNNLTFEEVEQLVISKTDELKEEYNLKLWGVKDCLLTIKRNYNLK